jgi:pentatricopeptide repeat protein
MPHLIALAVVAGAVLAAYAGAPTPVLVFDARVLVGENPILREASASAVGYLFTHDYWQPMATDGLYRPVTMLSFLVDYAVLGHADRATGYIVENVLLHGICAVLVYGLVRSLAKRVWPAAAAALVFGVHPVTTEAVTNVVGRADLLATAGVLAGILCWAHARRAAAGRRLALLVGLAASAVVALFSKESGIALVAAVLLYDLAFPPEPGRRLRAEHAVVAVVLVGYLLARWWVDRIGLPPEDVSPVDNPIAEAPFLLGRLTALGVLARELGLLVFPATLSVDYSFRQIPIVSWPPSAAGDWLAIGTLLVLPIAVVGLARLRRSEPRVFFLVGFAALALLPSANLLRVIGSIMAERFLYMPLAGFAGAAALVADGWARTPRRRTIATVVLAVVALAATIRTSIRNRDWSDGRTLWAATVDAVPESAKAHKGYAAALFEPSTSDPQELARVVRQAERAVEIRPDYLPAIVDLGSYYLRLGDAIGVTDGGAARLWYERAVSVLETGRPIDERTSARFVEKMRDRGNADDTIPEVGSGILYNNLAIAYVRLGNLELARTAYDSMRRLSPTSAPLYRDIAAIEKALGHGDEAAIALWQAIAIADDPDAKQQLADVYRDVPAGDAPIVTQGPSGETQVHTSHPVVRAHRCRALHELVAIFTRARLRTLADGARAEAADCGGA